MAEKRLGDSLFSVQSGAFRVERQDGRPPRGSRGALLLYIWWQWAVDSLHDVNMSVQHEVLSVLFYLWRPQREERCGAYRGGRPPTACIFLESENQAQAVRVQHVQ